MEDDPGKGGSPTPPSGDKPYKSFSSEDDFKQFQSKTFSSGYNNMQEKALNRLGEVLGEEVDDFDSALERVKGFKTKLADQITDPTTTNEYKELQNKLKDYQQKVDSLSEEKTSIQNQYKFDSIHSEAISELSKASELVIGEQDAKDLFDKRREVKWGENGNPIVYDKEGKPILDDNANYKPLKAELMDFYKSYTKPATDGTGGGSGDGGGVKPKFEDFKQAQKSDNREVMSKLIRQAKEAGAWAESDAPAVS